MYFNQNFSVPAGNGVSVTFDIDPGADLNGVESVAWSAYEQTFGVPTPAVVALITKTLTSGVSVLESPPQIIVDLDAADTLLLLRNYYHEVSYVDRFGIPTTLASGMMTVTQTENR